MGATVHLSVLPAKPVPPGVVGWYNLHMVYLNELCHENSNLGNCHKAD